MLVLFDHSTPAPLTAYLIGHTVTEARDRDTEIDGHEMRFNKPVIKIKGMVATNGLLHEQIERMIPHGGPVKS